MIGYTQRAQHRGRVALRPGLRSYYGNSEEDAPGSSHRPGPEVWCGSQGRMRRGVRQRKAALPWSRPTVWAPASGQERLERGLVTGDQNEASWLIACDSAYVGFEACRGFIKKWQCFHDFVQLKFAKLFTVWINLEKENVASGTAIWHGKGTPSTSLCQLRPCRLGTVHRLIVLTVPCACP